jgi:hypothetical protein
MAEPEDRASFASRAEAQRMELLAELRQQLQPENKKWLNFSTRIDLGHLLTALTIVVGALVYVLGYANKTDEAIKTANDVKVTVTSQITELKTTINDGNNEIKRQIANLPDVAARLHGAEQRLDQNEADRHRIDGEISRLGIVAAQNRSDIDNLMRASSYPLGPRR